MTQDGLKRKVISGTVWKGMERILAQMVSLVVSIVLARLLVPEDYSVISVVHIFFTFCNLFISEGINSALIQKKDSDELDYSTVFVINMLVATVLYIIMFFAAPAISVLYKNQLLVPVVRVMALTFFINGYKAVLSAKISSDLQFKRYFWATLGGTGISAVVGISMALNGMGAWALVAQQMTNSLVDSIILTFTTKIKFSFKFSYNRFKVLFSYGGKIFTASIITTIYNEIKPLIVGTKFSTSALAFYNRGESFPSMINGLVGSTLTSTMFPTMSKLQDDKEAIKNVTHRFISVTSFLIFPALLGFAALSDDFVRVVLTEKWMPASPYIKIFCVVYMLEMVQHGNLNAIKALGRSDVILKMEIIKKSAYAVIILLFIFFSPTPIMLACSAIACNIFATIVNTFPNRKLIGYGYIDLLKDLLPNLLISAIMYVVVVLVGKLPINIYALLILQVFTGVTVYILLAIISRNPNLKYAIMTVKNLKK